MAGQQITQGELQARFGYLTLNDEQRAAVEQVRSKVMAAAEAIAELSPPSREQSLSLTHLEEAAMWGNKAISRGET
jgi:hypothetical protein